MNPLGVLRASDVAQPGWAPEGCGIVGPDTPVREVLDLLAESPTLWVRGHDGEDLGIIRAEEVVRALS